MHPESPNKPTSETGDIYPARELDEFRPGNDHATIAAVKGLNIVTELERFRHYKKSRGAQSADWSSDFALWLIDTKPTTEPKRDDFASKVYTAPDWANRPKTDEIPGISISEFVPDDEHRQQCEDRGLDINTVFQEFTKEHADGKSQDWGNTFKIWLARC